MLVRLRRRNPLDTLDLVRVQLPGRVTAEERLYLGDRHCLVTVSFDDCLFPELPHAHQVAEDASYFPGGLDLCLSAVEEVQVGQLRSLIEARQLLHGEDF